MRGDPWGYLVGPGHSANRKGRRCKKPPRQALGALGCFLGRLASYILEPCWVYPLSRLSCLGTQLPTSVEVTLFYSMKIERNVKPRIMDSFQA